MSVRVPLVNAPGEFALIDDDDLPRVSQHVWRKMSPKPARTSYVYTTILGPTGREIMPLHRFVLGLHKGDDTIVDHVNRCGSDNRKANLRVVNASQNAANKTVASHTRSGFKGVAWAKREQKWRAYIKWEGKAHHLGYYDDKNEAATAYNIAVAMLQGEHGVQNTLPQPLPDATQTAIKERVENHLKRGFRRRK